MTSLNNPHKKQQLGTRKMDTATVKVHDLFIESALAAEERRKRQIAHRQAAR